MDTYHQKWHEFGEHVELQSNIKVCRKGMVWKSNFFESKNVIYLLTLF